MRKVLDSELEKIVYDLINKVNKDNFKPDVIVETGTSAHYLASKLSEYLSNSTIKLAGKRCNSDNPFLSLSYSTARILKKSLFKIFTTSQDNYLLNLLRPIVIKIYERNYPYISDNKDNAETLEKFSRESRILIADDNAFTGRTIDCVTDFLISKGFKKENIRSCVISTTNGYKPNYYSLEEAVSFPWNPIGV